MGTVTTVVDQVDAATYGEIVSLLAKHPHVFDNIALGAISAAYTEDAGMGEGRIADVAQGLPFGRVMFPHHTTDIVVHRVGDDTLRVWSKYFVIRGDGTAGSGDYQDTIVRTPDGWRIAERLVTRGNRPEDDPDGPSTRTLTPASWLAG